MKKIILFLLLLWNIFWVTYAQKLEVKANIPSGTYNFPIEINLLVNDKDAKIFYYTDWEGRMDHIKEFTKPILLKENIQLDFYGTTKNYEDTLIQTNYYTFKYSDQIILTEKNGKLVVKNNSWDIQNIWYWTIEADNFSYEITPNTFLDAWDEYETQYTIKNKETGHFYSPDKQLKQSFMYKKEIPEAKKEIPDTSVLSLPKNTEVTWVSDIKTTEEIKTLPPIHDEIKTSEKKDITLTSSLLSQTKSSLLESESKDQKNKSNNLVYILGFLIIFTLYNIWLFLKKNGTFEQMKTKINKIWKK